MKPKSAIALASVLFIFFGCASSSRQAKAKPGAIKGGAALAKKETANGPTVTCEMERTVGTMIPHRVCRDEEETERSRVEMQNKINSIPSVQNERAQ